MEELRSASFGRSSSLGGGSQRRREYHVLRSLGSGTKASVKLARHSATGELVAMKSIRKPERAKFVGLGGRGSSGGGDQNEVEYAVAEKEWHTEVAIIARTGNHENLPRLIDSFETPSKWCVSSSILSLVAADPP